MSEYKTTFINGKLKFKKDIFLLITVTIKITSNKVFN